MTENDVIAAAWAHVKSNGFRVAGLHSVQRFAASMIPNRDPSLGDLWVVRFEFPVIADAVISPDLLLIDVDDATGAASAFESL